MKLLLRVSKRGAPASRMWDTFRAHLNSGMHHICAAQSLFRCSETWHSFLLASQRMVGRALGGAAAGFLTCLRPLGRRGPDQSAGIFGASGSRTAQSTRHNSPAFGDAALGVRSSRRRKCAIGSTHRQTGSAAGYSNAVRLEALAPSWRAVCAFLPRAVRCLW